MTVTLTVISVQITASQLHAEQMEISSGSLYAFEQAWSVPLGIYYVYTNSERGLGVFRHLFIARFFFPSFSSLPCTVCVHTCGSCVAPCLRVDLSDAVPQWEASLLWSRAPIRCLEWKWNTPLCAVNYTNTNQMRIKTASLVGPLQI